MAVTLGTAVPVGPPPARTGSVHSWDVSTGVDGPGTRFVVFLAGCPLTCLYCHNPDTWRMPDGTRTGVDAVVTEARRHAAFIHAAGGGATLTGGEPLLQPAFCAELFHRFKHELGLHTALDTSGFLGARAGDGLLADVDLVLLDVKSWDRDLYLRLTGQHLEPTLDFARRLADLGKEVWVRFVLVPGLTDGPANVEGVAGFAASLGNVARVDVLPFHNLGSAKYRARGRPFPLEGTPAPNAEQLEAARSVFADHGLHAV
ncbi:pyruvate formate-lyase-activating enzyme [Kitasatospora herbaricolor]|uniref:pyruvate formate-lyase-activating protein n=1 Tax=Kitasatospora herbaricolor TaxID=68217 RepID=UPI00174C83AB|nr:pyruvate formate-lyase-activating protein [Kitasatospora herbaricolor]MDQ0312694.1 pyruvate formate lyase activating enzyme [Kitasatospora herbaricolor]GGV35159.1 pyruvate formate-lyase-activating enzyme [Kitasatospora herbaricolor]